MTRVILLLILTAACVSAFAEDADTLSVVGDVSVDTVINTAVISDVSVDTAGNALVNNDSRIDTADSASVRDVSSDTVQIADSDVPADTANTAQAVDFIDDDDYDLDIMEIAADTAGRRVHPNLIAREHEYRRQTKLAIAMMILIITAFATSQSWNPR